MILYVLLIYSCVDFVFEKGEGVWVIVMDGI